MSDLLKAHVFRWIPSIGLGVSLERHGLSIRRFARVRTSYSDENKLVSVGHILGRWA